MKSIKSKLQDNDKEMYLKHNKENSVGAERFVSTLERNL